jgi:thiamine biosynthesis lipoprotein
VKKTVVVMDTFVTIDVVERADGSPGWSGRSPGVDESVARAFEWFTRVEKCCSRFDRESEVSTLAANPGVPVPVSTMLFEALRFALAVAEGSGGAFDPTVGLQMERRGFNREYRTGQMVFTAQRTADAGTYRDVHLDPEHQTVTLGRSLLLDLGAVAKGLALDLAARELAPFENFAIEAGGDVYLAGLNADGRPWTVGIRHPREHDQVLETAEISNAAVCTSGDYERRSAAGGHILDPRTGGPAGALASATVVAPTAIMADALATAAFVLGPSAGLDLLNTHGVAGLLVTPSLERHVTTRPLQGLPA